MTGTEELEKQLGHVFRDRGLLCAALTHPSYAQVAPDEPNNQRLEFLGDAVLDLVLASELCRRFPDAREGFLSEARAALANTRTLAALADNLGLAAHVRLAPHEAQSGARERENLRADALEALIGAIFSEGGYAAAERAVLSLYGDIAGRLDAASNLRSAKGQLQEWAAKQPLHPKIEYILTAQTGPDHAKHFAVEVRVDGVAAGAGEGPSLRKAESTAAERALRGLEQQA